MSKTLTADARATIMDACHSISQSADALKAGCSIDGEWPDADDKAFYDAELRLLERLTALLATQQPEPRAEVTDEQPSLTNPLTPYGMLVRALRIVAGVTLMDMATALLTTPAKLSAMEFGRAPVTPEFAFDVAAYFDALDVPHTASALRAAVAARTGEGHADQA